jgi:hypothetical protein
VTSNERVVATAARYVGVREKPPGSNRGPLIDKWEKYWNLGYLGWPWCGAYASAVLRECGVTDVSHPSTAGDLPAGQGEGLGHDPPGAWRADRVVRHARRVPRL